MRIFILLIVVLFSISQSYSELKWEVVWRQVSGDIMHNVIWDIDCLDSKDCIMFTTYGGWTSILFHSSDGGKKWSEVHNEYKLWMNDIIKFRHTLNIEYKGRDFLYIAYKELEIPYIKRYTFPDMKMLDSIHINPIVMNTQSPLGNFFMSDSVSGIVSSISQDLFTTLDGWRTYKNHTWKGCIYNVENDISTWERHDTNSLHYFHGLYIGDVWMFNKNKYSYLSFAGRTTDSLFWSWFVYTEDDGNSWNPMLIGDDIIGNSLFFIDDEYGWVAGERPLADGQTGTYTDVIYATRDGGLTWHKQLDTNSQWYLGLNSISFSDRNHGIAVGRGSKLYRTTNGGDNWYIENVVDTNSRLIAQQWAVHIGRVPFIHTGGVGANTTKLFRYTGTTNISELLTNNNIQVNTYPNPFSESVSFEFPAELAGEQISLSIYDMLGNLQAEENFIYSPSKGILQYTPKHSPATGVYFYRLRIGDQEHTGTLIKQ